jgi:hypothetical protein
MCHQLREEGKKKKLLFDEVQLGMDPAGRYDSEVRKKSGRAEKREGAAARRARRGRGVGIEQNHLGSECLGRRTHHVVC